MREIDRLATELLQRLARLLAPFGWQVDGKVGGVDVCWAVLFRCSLEVHAESHPLDGETIRSGFSIGMDRLMSQRDNIAELALVYARQVLTHGVVEVEHACGLREVVGVP